jgi:serine/threonine protein phosphatase 1
MPPRTIAIGDIHGCSLALAALLEAIDPRPEDTIVTLGDYVDRGPDSRGVLELLIALGDHCRLLPLLGNHDDALLAAVDRRVPTSLWIGMGGLATLDSYGPGGDLALIPPHHLVFLKVCRDSYETPSHIFVHANYLPDAPISRQPRTTLLWDSLRERVPGPHCSGKTAIVGHTSQKNGEILDLGYLKCIDTYCHGGGWLTALEVESGRVWQADVRGELRR